MSDRRSWLGASSCGVLAAIAFVATSCSSAGHGSGDAGHGDGSIAMDAGAPDGGARDAADLSDVVNVGDAGPCVVRCGPAGICCHAEEECVNDRCLATCPGNRCGADDSACCTAEQLCVGGACIAPGAMCTHDSMCGAMETCEPLVGRCVPVPPEGAACEFRPPPGVFEPEIQWQWTDGNVMSVPLVVQTNDDDGDGMVTVHDIPDVVVVSYAPNTLLVAGHVTALSGDDGHLLWQTPDSLAVCPASIAAAGDLDHDGLIDIVTMTDCSSTTGTIAAHTVALSNLGVVKWTSTATTPAQYNAVAIADLDGDGNPEIVSGANVLSSSGALLWSAPELNNAGSSSAIPAGVPVIANIDADPELEVIVSDTAFNHDGSVLWRTTDMVPRGFTAVAHMLDGHAGPQVISIDGTTLRILDGPTGAVLLGPVMFETTGTRSGPPTIADFDGDGRAEIGTAGDSRYIVFDLDLPSPYVRWSLASEDISTGSVGSTVFDFDADGAAEVVYNDECSLHILRGTDGTPLWNATSTSRTIFEYPVVADVDNDGNAELITVSNEDPGFASQFHCDTRTLPFSGLTHGIRVYRDRLDHWVPTRTLWNQHAYHIDNVNDDGTIPAHETPSWTTHNTFRLNALPDPMSVYYAPDLLIVATGGVATGCPHSATLRARIENHGSRGVAAGVAVAFYVGDATAPGALLGVAHTTHALLAGAGEWVQVVVSEPPLDGSAQLRFHAVADDDGTGHGQHSECIEDNNAGSAITFDCSGVI